MDAKIEGMDVPDDLAEAVRFHGHLCPGLLIGYRAAKIGMARLNARRSEDEEFIAIVENNSCSVDAVQWLTGSTFGKGNFFFRDYGKQAFTFAVRPSGRAVRVALRPDAGQSAEVSELSWEEKRARRIRRLLSLPDEELFAVQEKTIELPAEAQIHESLVCDGCGERVMETRTVKKGDKVLCIPCADGK